MCAMLYVGWTMNTRATYTKPLMSQMAVTSACHARPRPICPRPGREMSGWRLRWSSRAVNSPGTVDTLSFVNFSHSDPGVQ